MCGKIHDDSRCAYASSKISFDNLFLAQLPVPYINESSWACVDWYTQTPVTSSSEEIKDKFA